MSNVAHLNTYCTDRIKTYWHSDHFLRHVGTSTRFWVHFLLLRSFPHRCNSWSSTVTASPTDGGRGSWACGVRLTTSTDGTMTPGIYDFFRLKSIQSIEKCHIPYNLRSHVLQKMFFIYTYTQTSFF